jgi:NADH-quinone oxidoreductase subunit L
VGAATALWAATIAVGQFDIKRVLAYSTISQLGFMVAAVGMGAYVAGMFHLVTHAFFKALLFLSAGSVIQALERGQEHASGAAHPAERSASGGHDEDAHAHAAAPPAAHHGPDPQDMRNMGGLWSKLPITKWVYLIGALALAGIFPLAGFWSKDEILLDGFTKGITEGKPADLAVYLLLTVAAFFTAFYMGRQILMVFFGQPRTDAAKQASESPRVMTYPLIVLAFLAFFGGALNLPGLFGLEVPGAHALTEWLGHTLGEAEKGELNLLVAGISTGLALVAIAISYAIYRGKPATAEERDPLQGMLGPVFTGMNRKWWVDEFYDLIILRPYNWLARISADLIDGRFWHDWFHDAVLAGLFNIFSRLLADGVDKGFVDPVISDFPADLSKGIAAFFRRVQTGFVRSYALAVFVGVVVVLGYFLIVR